MLGAQAHLLHHRLHLLAPFDAGQPGVDRQRLGQLVTDLLPRVERGIGVLEDHLHVPAQLPAVFLAGARHFAAGDLQGAGGGLLDQGQGAGEGGLAAAGLADHGEGAAGCQFEGHAIEGAYQGVGLEQATGDFVVAVQVAGGQYGTHRATSIRLRG
ncbi:hypothetical protein D9M69_602400 [compost metagenome]